MAEDILQTPPRTPVRPVPQKRKLGKIFLLIVSYAIVALVVWQIQKQWQMDPVRQQALAEQEIKDTVKKVGALMLLPANETPQVAVIQDAENLAKTQAFFATAKNDDQILIYLQDQKAIIYRPSENKIVNVGPIVANNATSTTQTNNRQTTTPQTQTNRPATSTNSDSEEN